MKTLTIKKDYFKKVLQHFRTDSSHLPSAEPNPSIKGMKEHYWGKDDLCVKVGTYVYLVTEEIYNYLLGGE